jgi:cell wall-associated NlpC family hydrolase
MYFSVLRRYCGGARRTLNRRGNSSGFQVPGSELVFLVLVLSLTTACASRQTAGVPVPRPFPGATLPAAEPRTANTNPEPGTWNSELLSTALSFQGTPYRNGGSDPAGFDCSGFVQWVFSRHGLALPREVKDQWRAGDGVDRDEIQPGDLVFFETVSRGASHVGIALDGDRFVHAPSSNGVVRIERYSSSYWSSRWVGARRVMTGS